MSTFGTHQTHHGEEPHLKPEEKNHFLGSTIPTTVYGGLLLKSNPLPPTTTNTLSTFTSSNPGTQNGMEFQNGFELKKTNKGVIIEIQRVSLGN